jgi:hypothetical protein
MKDLRLLAELETPPVKVYAFECRTCGATHELEITPEDERWYTEAFCAISAQG